MIGDRAHFAQLDNAVSTPRSSTSAAPITNLTMPEFGIAERLSRRDICPTDGYVEYWSAWSDSLAAQGLTDQRFHIIRLSIDAPWIELWDLKGVGGGRKVWYPAVSGPLSAYAAGMRARRYSPSAISDRLWQFDQLSRWLDRKGLPVVELTLAQCLRFAASRRAGGVVTVVAPQSMTLPYEYLRALGLTPAPPPVPHGPVEDLLADYGRYLLIERGLTPRTQGTSNRTNRPTRSQAGQIPRNRRTPGVPRSEVIMWNI